MRFKPGNRWKSSRSEVRYRTWRKNVFELNKRKLGLSRNYVCVKCNKKRKTTRVLHAHHIYSWNKFESKRYDRNNGVVLCKYCHNKQTHTPTKLIMINFLPFLLNGIWRCTIDVRKWRFSFFHVLIVS